MTAPSGTTVGPTRKKPALVTLDTIEPKEIKWLWYPYIPIGTCTAIYGRGGMGKSFITCDIASRLSTGTPLPGADDQKRPQKVLMLSAEDDYPTVLVPRLMRLGARLENIAVPSFQFVLDTKGVDDIRELMREFAATVVFIDPIVYYAGGKMDMNRSNEVRAMMEKLKSAADESQSAVIIVGHVKKSQEGNDQDQMMGSADWINAARSGLLVTRTNDGTKIMKHAKTNYGAFGDHRAFVIDDDGLHWGETYTDDDLPATGGKAGRPMTQRSAAIAFIIATLSSGPMPATEFLARAADEEISQATLNRAKSDVAESYFDKTEKRFFWRLLPTAGVTAIVNDGDE